MDSLKSTSTGVTSDKNDYIFTLGLGNISHILEEYLKKSVEGYAQLSTQVSGLANLKKTLPSGW